MSGGRQKHDSGNQSLQEIPALLNSIRQELLISRPYLKIINN
jgi:hypothetical protein